MKPESNKAKDFARYKEKWGLKDYSFKIVYKDKIMVVPVNCSDVWGNGEIRTVHNLMKRRNSKFLLRETTSSEYVDFNGLDELLEYMLIRKMAF